MVKSVNVLNAGWGGARALDWDISSQPYGPTLGIAAIAPALTVIELGVNDWDTAVSPSAFQTAMQDIINAAKVTGDVIILTPPPTNTGVTSANAQQALINVMHSLADTNGIPIIDEWTRMGSWSVNNVLGLTADNFHLNNAGYVDYGNIVGQRLLSAR